MILRFGEVVLIRMQFHQTAGVRARPAVVLLDTGETTILSQRLLRRNRGIRATILRSQIGAQPDSMLHRTLESIS